MLNALRVDIKRYLMTRSLMLFVLFAAVLIPLFQVFILMAMCALMKAEYAVTLNDFSGYSSLASIYLAIMITLFLHTEAGEGIIRNKIISGKKRFELLLSYCIVNASLAAVLEIVSVIVTALTVLAAGSSFQVTAAEIIRFAGVNTLAGVALSVLYTVSYLCFCNFKAGIAVPAGIAVAMKIMLIIVMDALYTNSGIPKVSGMTLSFFRGIDRYVAFSHLNGTLRWDNASYLIGNTVMITAAVLTGILVFGRKDLK